MTMFMVNIADAKAKLSDYLDAVTRGERVVICNRNRPIAELRAVPASVAADRDLAPMFPDWQAPPSALEPLDEDELRAWGDVRERDAAHGVAESTPAYPKAARSRRRKRS
jgi:antitoxin (DNA-binding transcriptional repressor) of toxin-antitoxin stability system